MKRILRSLKQNRYKITGGLGGLLMALLLIFAWPLLLIIFLVIIGVFLGGIFDAGRRVGIFLDHLFSLEKKTSNKKTSQKTPQKTLKNDKID